MLLRLAYLGITNAMAMLRLLPLSDHDKDVEILTLRHQISVLQRQLGAQKPRFQPADRALLAALLHRLPRPVRRNIRVLGSGRLTSPPEAGKPTTATSAVKRLTFGDRQLFEWPLSDLLGPFCRGRQ